MFLHRSLALWKRRLAYRQRRLRAAKRAGSPSRTAHWQRRVVEAERRIARITYLLTPLRVRALHQAQHMVGVMEVGGNNVGPTVSKIIRANGGTPGEPWCGDFVAWCYRNAGSRSVTRSWAAVRLLAAGNRIVRQPRPGDIVRFTFDHTGIYVKDAGAFIETIEGNTGASGAVSDSKTGGDGVYKKRRPKNLVSDYVRISR